MLHILRVLLQQGLEAGKVAYRIEKRMTRLGMPDSHRVA
jgi:hypothetical protein